MKFLYDLDFKKKVKKKSKSVRRETVAFCCDISGLGSWRNQKLWILAFQQREPELLGQRALALNLIALVSYNNSPSHARGLS